MNDFIRNFKEATHIICVISQEEKTISIKLQKKSESSAYERHDFPLVVTYNFDNDSYDPVPYAFWGSPGTWGHGGLTLLQKMLKQGDELTFHYILTIKMNVEIRTLKINVVRKKKRWVDCMTLFKHVKVFHNDGIFRDQD